MRKRTDKADDPLAELKQSIRAGKLADVKAWIDSGKPTMYEAGSKLWSPLEVAAKTGFYAMVELLVTSWDDRATLNRALERALKEKQPEIAKLLVEHGADVNTPDLEMVAECYNADLMSFFLDKGVDISMHDALARAIAAKARPLLGVFKKYCAQSSAAQVQLAKALKYFIREKDVKGISLCLWMGADTRLKTPDMGSGDEEEMTSAIEDAYFEGDYEIVKKFKIDSETDDPNQLMRNLFRFDSQILEHLLEQGASLNDKPNGGSSLLERSFSTMRLDAMLGSSSAKTYTSRVGVSDLIARGAKLAPDDAYVYRDIRDMICSLNERERPEMLRLLARAAAPEVIFKIINTPRMRRELGIPAKRAMQQLGIEETKVPPQQKLTRTSAGQAKAQPRKQAENLKHQSTVQPSIPGTQSGSVKGDRAVRVSNQLRNPHPLVAQTQEAAHEVEEVRYGWRNRKTQGAVLDIDVPSDQLPRALRVMDALIKAIETRGHSVRISRDRTYQDRNATYAVVMDTDVPFGIRGGKDRLCLFINHHIDGIRCNWRDGKKQKIENTLASFMDTLVLVAEREKKRQADLQRRREEQERERLRLEAQETMRKEEERRVQQLMQEVAGWHQTRQVREYVSAVSLHLADKHGTIAPDSDAARWIEWASKQADRMDPLCSEA